MLIWFMFTSVAAIIYGYVREENGCSKRGWIGPAGFIGFALCMLLVIGRY